MKPGRIDLNFLTDIVCNTVGLLVLLSLISVVQGREKRYLVDVPVEETSRQRPVFFVCRDSLMARRHGIQEEVAVALGSSLKSLYDDRSLLELEGLADRLTASRGLTLAARIRQQFLGMEGGGVGGWSGWSPLEVLSGLVHRRGMVDEHRAEPTPSTLRLLEPLQERLAASVAAHELQHQLHTKEKWSVPRWAGRLWRACSEAPVPHMGLQEERPSSYSGAVAGETAGYLVQVVHGRGVRAVIVGQLLSFALNPGLEGAPEHFAAHAVLSSLAGRSPELGCPGAEGSAEIFVHLRYLSGDWDDERLGEMAARAYEDLFSEEVPLF